MKYTISDIERTSSGKVGNIYITETGEKLTSTKRHLGFLSVTDCVKSIVGGDAKVSIVSFSNNEYVCEVTVCV